MFSSTDVRAERNKDAAGLGGNHILTRLYKQSEIDYMGSYLDQTNTVVSRWMTKLSRRQRSHLHLISRLSNSSVSSARRKSANNTDSIEYLPYCISIISGQREEVTEEEKAAEEEEEEEEEEGEISMFRMFFFEQDKRINWRGRKRSLCCTCVAIKMQWKALECAEYPALIVR